MELRRLKGVDSWGRFDVDIVLRCANRHLLEIKNSDNFYAKVMNLFSLSPLTHFLQRSNCSMFARSMFARPRGLDTIASCSPMTVGLSLGVLCLSCGLMGCSGATVARQLVVDTDRPVIAQKEPGTEEGARGQMLPVGAIATISGEAIQLEVTRTPAQQAMGLMFRPALPDDRGMLFSFDPPRPVSFWMKNVPVDLDMIFLREGVVMAIAQNVPPCTSDPCPTYSPGAMVKIDRAIELRGGRAAELEVAVGDRIDIEFLDLEESPQSFAPKQGVRSNSDNALP